jgi:hypothetical protein
VVIFRRTLPARYLCKRCKKSRRRAAPASLAGLEVGLEARGRPALPDCDRPTLLTAFGYFACGFYKRGATVVRLCPLCGSRFEDHSPWDGPAWTMANLDEPLLPSADLMFGHLVKWTLPWTAEAHQRKLRQLGIKT